MKIIHPLIFLCITGFQQVFAQESTDGNVSLQEVLSMAREQSLNALKAKNLYLASYWEYRSFKSGLLPNVGLQLNPFSYNRIMTKRYDSESNTDVFREQQTLNSYANLQINQNIGLTGAKVYIDTDISRLVNFGGEKLTTYSATPLRIGVSQPLFAHNQTKWQHTLAPLKLERAKKEFTREQQNINIHVVNLYFELLLANVKKNIAQKNIEVTAELYEIGKKRFDLIAIDKKGLLDLELNRYNAEIELAKANKDIQRAGFNLNSFLGRSKEDQVIPIVPGIPGNFQIDVNEAVSYAFDNSPKLLELKQQGIENKMDLDKTIRENRLSVDVNASYGLNQRANTFENAYSNLLDQEVVSVSMYIPILDWGKGQGQKEMAKRRNEVSDIEIKQAARDFEQEVVLKVIDFNLQERVVNSALKADSVAGESYALAEKKFRNGSVDVLALTTAMKAKETARQNYISTLFAYWVNYYEIQQLTLYDFSKQVPLKEEVDEILKLEE